MRKLWASVRNHLRSERRIAPARPDSEPTSDRLKARHLADAIDRAMTLGLWAHADRLVRSASRLMRHAPRLSERIARVRLARGNPETALAIIDGCGERTASLRLLRNACLITLGRAHEAHADLLQWSQKATAPLDARIMLALLEWRDGDDHAAKLALLRNLRHLEDPRSLELLVLMAAANGPPEHAQRWAARLRDCSAFGAGSHHLRTMLYSLGLTQRESRRQPTNIQVETLAMELLTAEQVIPALVEAQTLSPQIETIELLYRAIEHTLGELDRQDQGVEALARLALLMGDRAGARWWAARGVERNPMSASLSMLLSRLGDAETQPEADDRPVIGRIGDHLVDQTDHPAEKAA